MVAKDTWSHDKNHREMEQTREIENYDRNSTKRFGIYEDIQSDKSSREFGNNIQKHKQTVPSATVNGVQCCITERQHVDSVIVTSNTDAILTCQTESVHSESETNANNKNALYESDDTNLPIDRGWAWMILLASLLVHFIAIGQIKCFGIFFVQFQRRFGSTSYETSLIFTVMNATYSVAALLNLTIGSNVPTRLSMSIGAVISCIGSITTGLIYDARIACITYGAGWGIANAFIMPQVSTTISSYFVRRRGFANNAMNGGIGLGAIVLAPLVTLMFEYYGFTGTFIIITGLNLNLMVITCLVRPISFYRKKGQRVKETEEEVIVEETRKLLIVDDGTIENDAILRTNHFDCHRNGFSERNDMRFSSDTNKSLFQKSKIDKDILRRRYISENDNINNSANQITTAATASVMNSTTSRFASTNIINTSLMDLTFIQEKDTLKAGGHTSEHTDDIPKTHKNAFRKLFAKLFDFKLLSNPVFQYYLLCNALLSSGSGMALAYLPTHAIEMGVSEEMAALLVSVSSILDIVSKFIFGYLSDKGWCHRSTLIAVACLILGIAAQFMYFMTTFSTMMIYAVIGGLLQGIYFALFVVVIIDILAMENLKGALGFISLVQGVTGGACLPIAGYLRDYSGSYNYTFIFIGWLLIVGAILCYFLPNVHEWHENKLKRKTQQQV